jgi:hypothetical protein
LNYSPHSKVGITDACQSRDGTEFFWRRRIYEPIKNVFGADYRCGHAVSEDYWRDKEMHYRRHPRNINCITAAGIDCCCLAMSPPNPKR